MSLTKEFFKKNRINYLEKVDDNTLTILFSGRKIQRSADQDYDFEVDKNFYYLSGINQDNVILLLAKKEGKLSSFLFIEKTDPFLAKWYGKKLTKEEAIEISGVDKVLDYEKFDSFLFGSFNNLRNVSLSPYKKVYLSIERRNDKGFTNQTIEFAHSLKEKYFEIDIENCYSKIVNLRMYKDDEELNLIKESISITKGGVEELMKNSKAGLYEYQLESYFDHYIKTNGQKDWAFKTIAAGGINATILHYQVNNTILNDGDLVLFDLGCRSELYVSDISRTFPVNGKFTPRQKEVYEKVLNVNKKCIEFLKPGITWNEYNEYAKKLLIEAAKDLHLIVEDDEITKYYWHSIGHGIGLDTHDPSLYTLPITEGMVLTVEPGLYIEEEKIGIRIEDNVLITKDKAINLSKDIIKEVKDIEAFMKK